MFYFIYFLIHFLVIGCLMKFLNKSCKITDSLIHLLKNGYSIETVTYLSLIWLTWIVLLPLFLLIIWGVSVATRPEFTAQAGYGIIFFGGFLHFTLIGFCNWYGRNWNLTPFTKIMLLCGVISAFLYCFCVTLNPETFTYSGTTAIFMSFNYIFVIALTHIKSEKSLDEKQEKYLKLDILLKHLVIGDFFI